MEAILTAFFAYAAIWAPSLVAVLGVVATVVLAIAKTRAAIQEFKGGNEIKDLIDTNKKQGEYIEELVRCNKLLLDQITHIQEYADRRK